MRALSGCGASSAALCSLLLMAPGLGRAQSAGRDAGQDEAAELAAGQGGEESKAERIRRDRECLVCHAGVGQKEAPKLSLKRYSASAHGDVGCVHCHTDVEDEAIEHEKEDQDLAPVRCAGCHEHEDEQEGFEASRHAKEPDDPDKEMPTCATCHGDHYVLPADNPRSRVHPLNQLHTCGQCHGTHRKAAGHMLEVPEQYRTIFAGSEDEVLRNLFDEGQLVSAGCTDCHGKHRIISPGEEGSTLTGDRILETCGKCHEDVRDEFLTSIHAKVRYENRTDAEAAEAAKVAKAEGKPTEPPLCITCHGIHRSEAPGTDRFRADLVKECGNCHEALMETYQESYHGKATTLGRFSVAQCSDCHGYHAILPPDDPQSQVHPDNKLETCRQCHKDAPANFASFWPHADHGDPEQYPVLHTIWIFMTALLVSVFTFFGLHTLLWALREAIDAAKHGGPRRHQGGRPVSRFSTADRVTHFFVIVSFLGLAATGAPLKFAETDWAKVIFALIGGVEAAGWWHRLFAIITFGYFSSHVVLMTIRLSRHARAGTLGKAILGPDSLLPLWSDVTDVLAHIRYFLGVGKKPTWDRWTYWEKFDYWAVFWGVAVIGSTGLILWFPTFFTYLLPGWMLNIALVVHSDEALLAIGFIFGIHFFNGHLRRSKFPMDPVMFTGTVPEDEYRLERGREWERLEEEGGIEDRIGEKVSRNFIVWSHVFGISAWIVGLLLLALIVHGFFGGR